MWVEYVHNSLPTSATGMSLFKCAFGYQPPLFPSSEMEITVPSAHGLVRHCHKIWAAVRNILLRSANRIKRAANRKRRPVPPYQPGQKVWLSTRDLPLHVMSRKLASRFLGPYPISKVIGPSSVRLPRTFRVHPTFHVSRVKPVNESAMVPATIPPPPPQMIDDGLVYMVKNLLAVRNRGRAGSSSWGGLWSRGAVMDPCKFHYGSRPHHRLLQTPP